MTTTVKSIQPAGTPAGCDPGQATQPPAVVEVVGVTKQFGKVTALHEVNLCVYQGEFLTLLGPSGCGKTTLLRIIAGLEQPSRGRVFIEGQDMTRQPPERRPLNMVFQRYALFPHLSVAENIAFGLRLKRLPEAEVQQRVAEAMSLVRLAGLDARLPHQLSGGQAQRVALARALVNRPKVLLLDEPLSALDRKIRQQMQDELRAIQSQVGTTFLYVTHDQDEAMAMSTRVVLMCDGRITQVARPAELYLQPGSEFAANFIGDANLLAGRVVATPDGLAIEWGGCRLEGIQIPGRRVGDPVQLMVRPEAIRLHNQPPPGAACIPGRVARSSFYGFYWLHRVTVEGQTRELIVRELSETTVAQPGAQVWVTLDVTRTIVLP